MQEENLDGPGRDAIPQVIESNVVDFQARRWDPARNPGDFRAHEAINTMVRDIQAGKAFDHIIVCYTRVDPATGGPKIGYVQAGELHGNFAAIGLLQHVSHMIVTKT